jgi:flavin-dependent dehydrogenase
MSDHRTVDLLVIGAGMAGLTAGARAARNGLTVVVVEIGGDVGGSARYAGYAWTAPSHEVMERHNPGGDASLKRALVDRFQDGIAWIRSTGVEAKDAQPILSFGQGHQFDTNHYVDTCRRIIVEAGGELLLATDTEQLLLEDGAVTGAELVTSDGTRRTVRATSTLLATGGFQGDVDLRNKLVHPTPTAWDCAPTPTAAGPATAWRPPPGHRPGCPGPASTDI